MSPDYGLDGFLASADERLLATTDYDAIPATDVTFVVLPASAKDDGSSDRSIVTEGMRSLGEGLAVKPAPHDVVAKVW